MSIRLVEAESGTQRATRADVHVHENAEPVDSGDAGLDLLRSYVDRLISVTERRAELGEDLAEILKEAHGNGFNKAALKSVVKIKTETVDKREKRRLLDADTQLYLERLGID